MQPEAKLHAALQRYIRAAGGCCFKIHGGDNPFQSVGIPDLLCCYRGRFIGIEVKMPEGILRPAQVVALGEIYRAGGIAAVVETIEQGRKLLLNIKNGRMNEGPILYDRGFTYTAWGRGPRRT